MSQLVFDVSANIQNIIDVVNAANIGEARTKAIEELLGTVVSVLAEAEGAVVINFDAANAEDGVYDIGHGHEVVKENGNLTVRKK